MASKMSADLALQNANDELMSEYERSRRQATWAGMVQLHMTANTCKRVLDLKSDAAQHNVQFVHNQNPEESSH
jgi:hypothetical protein